jgi:serine O-acetyltransferase
MAVGQQFRMILNLIKTDRKAFSGNIIKYLVSAESRAVLSFRFYSFAYLHISKVIGYIWYNHAKKKYNFDIHPLAKIGGGFKIIHLGSIVIGGQAIIGKSVCVNSCVTIGEKNPKGGMPSVGNNVYIGTGAKLLGKIIIANNVLVGANAVVVCSFFETNSVVAGIPAKIKK